jgi:hypothetical protein
MADQADVENALAALVANALYPNGAAAPSVVGCTCRIYRGLPTAPALDGDLAAGIVNVSVVADAGPVKNVTRYPRSWVAVTPVAETLDVAVQCNGASFSGRCAVGQLAGVIVDGAVFPYAVQSNDSPATVASNLAATLRAAGWIVNYSGSSIIVPAAQSFSARVVAGAGALLEMKRQIQGFRISLWCPDPGSRDAVAPAIDGALCSLTFIPLADGSSARIMFQGGLTQDGTADASLYRRDLVYDAEFPTTLAQIMPAMLFGDTAFTVNAISLENLTS